MILTFLLSNKLLTLIYLNEDFHSKYYSEGHRPLWPVFGEYEFVPPQRWLHSIEHGAVVMLYHPCADFYEVKKLKNLVQSCTWKHVITPWNMLNEEMVRKCLDSANNI